MPVTLDVVERLGAKIYAYGRTDFAAPVTAELAVDRAVAAGDRLDLSFGLQHVRLFDAEGRRIGRDLPSPGFEARLRAQRGGGRIQTAFWSAQRP
ncbi:MAG: hypothetical protein P4L98_14125, partial [Ancalomicrobiaceae bacterium]|nr:hypothetical protein [Ancalomicrobiaceae bacterium]